MSKHNWVPVGIKLTVTNDHVLIKFDQDDQIYAFSKEDVYVRNTLSEMALAKAIGQMMIVKKKRNLKIDYFPAALCQPGIKKWINLGCPQPR